MSLFNLHLCSLFFVIYFVVIASYCKTSYKEKEIFQLSVIHFNDFHARFEETDLSGNICKNKSDCIGGYSRLYSQISLMKKINSDSIILNAGDVAYGTFWHTIGGWNISQEFMNKLPIDAEVLGNHEFDSSIEGVVPYIKALQHPVVIANMDATFEPNLHGIFTKSSIIQRGNKKIGIIGLVASNFNELAKTRNITFLPTSSSVNLEAERLVNEEGVFTNIVVTHAGYEVDKSVAANASRKISLIVGGHSHSLLLGEDLLPIPDAVEGPYPTLIKSRLGHKVAVVQAAAFCRVLGNISIFLNANGELIGYSGKPILLDRNIPQDIKINEELLKWKEHIETQGKTVVGTTTTYLNVTECSYKECSLGDLVTDAMLDFYSRKVRKQKSFTYDIIAITSKGSLRDSIEKGSIIFKDLTRVLPFKNTIDIGEIEGKYLKELFEFTTLPPSTYHSRLLQISGARVIYNMTCPPGSRVVSIKVLSQNSVEEVYKELVLNWTYNLVMPDFLTLGGDNFDIIPANLKNITKGPIDVDLLREYLENNYPLYEKSQDRLTFYV